MKITTDPLRALLQESPVQLLDVRLGDDFEAAHLPGAHNNCVYEVAFADRLADTAPQKDVPTIVYGAHTHSIADPTQEGTASQAPQTVATISVTDAAAGGRHDNWQDCQESNKLLNKI